MNLLKSSFRIVFLDGNKRNLQRKSGTMFERQVVKNSGNTHLKGISSTGVLELSIKRPEYERLKTWLNQDLIGERTHNK